MSYYVKVIYEISEYGGCISLQEIEAPIETPEEVFKILDEKFHNMEFFSCIHLDDDGVYEMTLKVFDDNNEGYGDDYSFAICQLLKMV